MDFPWAGPQFPALLVFSAMLLTGFSGLPGLLLASRPGLGQSIATWSSLLGAILGMGGAVALLVSNQTAAFSIAWTLPFGACDVTIDSLSSLFLLPIFLISGCTALYAGDYWPATSNRQTEPLLTFSLGALVAAMALVVIARNGVLFLMAWEVMALAAGLALTVEHNRREVREAGSIYLIATHTGTLALFLMFALLRKSTGSFVLPPGGSLEAAGLPAAAIFVCAMVGFGSKAGLMPFHIWLPSAHANAPSHISAIMSGVMLKMGVYGILRIISLFHGQPLWWGMLLLGCGAVSALLGIVFALAQNDMKRLLAYSSIENIGIIAMGLGVALIAMTRHHPLLGLLGLSGALLHILNHSLFKPLLFLGAGALIHGTHTRLIDLMGGLARRMPWTAVFFLVGAVAICGLPPLNGFAGEFLLYAAFFTDATTSPAPYLALAAPLLALIGGLAMVCFLKLYGVALLGEPRSAAAAHSHEPGWRMLVPMGGLALLCGVFGLVPQLLFIPLTSAVAIISPQLAAASGPLVAAAPLHWLTLAGIGLLLLAALFSFTLRRRVQHAPIGTGVTWGCGYLRPGTTMQYTSSSFVEPMVRLFGTVIRSRFGMPQLAGYFPREATFHSQCPETVLERVITPLFMGVDFLFSLCRRLQHGAPQIYLIYIFITLLLLMVWGH